MTTYIITEYELRCDADDFSTEDGQGFPEGTEPYELDTYELTGDDDDCAAVLDSLGLGQWDGGSVAYDPDGSRLTLAGEQVERYAVVKRDA